MESSAGCEKRKISAISEKQRKQSNQLFLWIYVLDITLEQWDTKLSSLRLLSLVSHCSCVMYPTNTPIITSSRLQPNKKRYWWELQRYQLFSATSSIVSIEEEERVTSPSCQHLWYLTIGVLRTGGDSWCVDTWWGAKCVQTNSKNTSPGIFMMRTIDTLKWRLSDLVCHWFG